MNIPTYDELQLLHSTMCQSVGDPRRLQIIYALSVKPMYVSELAQELEVPQPTVSRHLSMLKQRGVVRSERDGTAVIYSLTDTRIVEVIDMMRDMMRTVMSQKQEVLGD